MRKLAAVAVSLSLLCACGPSSAELRAKRESDERARAEATCREIKGEARLRDPDCVWLDCPGISREQATDAARGVIAVGMGPCAVVAVMKSEPRRKNVSSNGHRTQEQWVWGDDLYVYLEDGKVTSWSYSQR